MMLFTFILVSWEKRSRNLLSMMNSPEFARVEKDLNGFIDNEKKNVDITIEGEGHIANHTRKLRDLEYYKSSITILNSEFKNSFAFGSTSASGSGGSVFVCQSSLFIQGASIFASNLANVGGAICCLLSTAHINGLTDRAIIDNMAYKYGGAIYFQGYEEQIENKDKNINKVTLIIQNSIEHTTVTREDNKINYNFLNNKSGEYGGAICISFCSSASLEKCYFINNSVDINGGAISAINSNLHCSHCVFDENKATLGNKVYRASGGGAIHFLENVYMALDDKNNAITKKSLSTEGCCFYKNDAKNGSISNSGHDLMFSGLVKWSSYLDSGKNDNLSVAYEDIYGDEQFYNCIDFNKEKEKCFGVEDITNSTYITLVPTKESDKDQVPTKESDKDQVPTKESDKDQVPTKESDKDQVPTKESDKESAPTKESDKDQVPTKESDKDQVPTKDSNQNSILIKESNKDSSNGVNMEVIVISSVMGAIIFFSIIGSVFFIYRRNNMSDDSSTDCSEVRDRFTISSQPANKLYQSDDENATLSTFVLESETDKLDDIDYRVYGIV